MSSDPYLSLSFKSSLPFLQEKEALGEACGRHSMMTSPPLCTKVDFFSGLLEKSGGEAANKDITSVAVLVSVWAVQTCSGMRDTSVFYEPAARQNSF